MSYARQHLQEAARIIEGLDADAIERMAEALASVRSRGGRLFFLGVGGSAATARMRSTTSASSPASRRTPRPTTCRS